ncbi:MAG: hypothetical protein M3Y32_02385 [Pseudomonadota bacterium]|nr:hypothetical protein [Pseudomonadota bacterium]
MPMAALRSLFATACLLSCTLAFGATRGLASAAADAAKPSWTVLHCGVAKGVLYLTYAEDGHAAITPAVDNRAVRAACAKAGYPVGGAAPARVAVQPVSVEPAASGIGIGGGGGLSRRSPVPLRVEPSFTAQAVGSSLSVDARNDGDVPQSCLVSFSWTWDGNPGAPRSSSTQVSLPARQRNRVVTLTAPGYGARFLASPKTACRALQ